MKRCTGWLPALALAGLLAGCPTGKPEMQPAPATVPADPQSSPSIPLLPPPLPFQQKTEPLGLYFLHNRSYGAEACEHVGDLEVRTGPGRPGYSPQAPLRTHALDRMAHRARAAGGNVVVLPHFGEEFSAGYLSGRAYRCASAQRKDIFARARGDRGLTIVVP